MFPIIFNTKKHLIYLTLIVVLLFSAAHNHPAQAAKSLSLEDSQTNQPGHPPNGLTATEWSDIQMQIDASIYGIYLASGGYVSTNPAHDWKIAFSEDGLTSLTPRHHTSPRWQWGLRLTGVGYSTLNALSTPSGITTDGQKLTYQWRANPASDSSFDMSEWWMNTPSGLEQGFTLQARPGDANGQPLRLTMIVTGGLIPVQTGNTIAFQDDSGAIVFTYTKLHVTDALNQVMPARFSLSEEENDGESEYALYILVDDSGAQYPLTIDPLIQQAYIKASNTDADDHFGRSVAISGDTLVVGAPEEDSNATGVNGEQSNNGLESAGAAYVFTRDGTTWSQQAYLKASNTDSGDFFGFGVSISGDTIAVSAHREASGATGIKGDQSDNSAADAGAVYVFTRDGTTWSQQAYVKASNTDAGDRFGYSLAISGDTLVVGAYGEDSNATGVGGNQANNGVYNSGAAYVFTRSGTTWTQQAYIKASNTEEGDWFGYSVAVSEDTLVVSAFYEDSSATGVNGNQSDNSASGAGAVYVFSRSGITWSQQAYLKASNTGADDGFGMSVAISDDTLVVGAYGEDSNATGVDGNQSDNSASESGAAYVFSRSGLSWTQQAYLKASNTGTGDCFGISVAIFGDTVVVGAYQEDSNATGVDGNQSNNLADNAGAAYVFSRNGTTWSQQSYLKASNTGNDDWFGNFVAISYNTVVVGSIFEDSNATGVDGNQSDNSAYGSGAVYAYLLQPELALTKSVTPLSAKPGDAIAYTIAFSNTSAITATDVIITDTLSDLISNPGYTSQGVNLTPVNGWCYAWTAPDLWQGDGGIITITGVLTQPLTAGVLSNTVTLAASGITVTADAPLVVESVAPVANAGVDQTTNVNQTVILNGSNSTDINGDELTYGWMQTGGLAVTLIGSDNITSTFTTPLNASVLTFTLSVTDTSLLVDTDTVIVTIFQKYFLPLILNYSPTP